jgi:hypothetical protein
MTILAIWFEEQPYIVAKNFRLVGFNFVKCYIDDNIAFSLILKDHVQHL